MRHVVYIGLGSNVGDRVATLRRALEMLEADEAIEVRQVSRFIATEPVGPPQARYTNAAARLETDLEPHEMLVRLHAIEAQLGRDRSREVRWGPRTCDLDILLFDDAVIDTPDLSVPHPRLHERAFVLVPLAQIAPGVRHPVLGRTIGELSEALEDRS